MIDELDTEAGSDILILGNGTDPDDYSTTLDEFSGRADGEGAFSISRETWLRFSTDGSVTYEGFSLQIYAVENGEKKKSHRTVDNIYRNGKQFALWKCGESGISIRKKRRVK